MRIREDVDRLEDAEKALGLRDSDGEDLTEKVADDTPAQEDEGAEEEVEETSPDDAQPSESETDEPTVPEDPTGTLPEDGAQARKLAGKFDTPEELERAYQEALTLAGRHGQELGTWRQQAEQRAREAEELRQQLQQREQATRQDAERQALDEILSTPYDRLNDQQRDYLDAWAEHYGTDPMHFQATLRIQADAQRQWQAQQQAREDQIQEKARVNYLGNNLKTWLQSQPDADLLPEVVAEAERRPYLFRAIQGQSPEEEFRQYQEVFEDLFVKARYRRNAAEAERQKAIVSQQKQQQAKAFDGRRSAAGEAANSPAPRAPLPSAPPKAKSPVDDILETKKRRTLANLING